MLKPFYNGCSKHESIEDYESYLKEDSNGEDPSFDLLLLGFGEDGHIASLFPNDEFAKSGDKVISVESKHNDYQRLSLGLSQLKRSSNTIIISYGEKKYNLLNKSQDLNLPIQQFIKDQVNVTWYHKE
jgi:6-phosphogluconolactonase/glucosamine-6-phosphate isomerase/deaminase